ncbi:MAG TPA: DUF488 domain-containing protein [Gemmatimonadaceae bacterium]|nr:DUF488 domain-containing protein [Gemmatimonadaceae bacterium]
MTVWTIGHSTRESDAFVALLQRERIERLWDVRAFPMSRRYPHFNRETLSVTLREVGIDYEHAPQLGGRRSLPKTAPPSAWRNAGFKAYAAYMATDEFRTALAGLRRAAAEKRTTIMCAEAVHWRCHRGLISDALVAAGDEVLHIGDSGVTPHALTSFAVVSDGEVRYPPEGDDGQLTLLAGAD